MVLEGWQGEQLLHRNTCLAHIIHCEHAAMLEGGCQLQDRVFPQVRRANIVSGECRAQLFAHKTTFLTLDRKNLNMSV